MSKEEVVKHLQAFEEERSSDVVPSPSPYPTTNSMEFNKRLANPTIPKFEFSGFKTLAQIEASKALAFRCPFCRELPYLSKAYRHRTGDNRVVYCGTTGCAIYKFAIVIRIWNARILYLVNSTVKECSPGVNELTPGMVEQMEDISGRRKDD